MSRSCLFLLIQEKVISLSKGMLATGMRPNRSISTRYSQFQPRNDLNAWHSGNALVAAVAAVNKNTVVVVHSVGQIVMESWIDHANGEQIYLCCAP
jgi:hypothetical protein